jgi:hypothetical protein
LIKTKGHEILSEKGDEMITDLVSPTIGLVILSEFVPGDIKANR